MLTKLYISAMVKKEQARAKIQSFVAKEDGINIIDIIVVLAILLALAIVFRKQLKELFDQIWATITTNTTEGTTQY